MSITKQNKTKLRTTYFLTQGEEKSRPHILLHLKKAKQLGLFPLHINICCEDFRGETLPNKGI